MNDELLTLESVEYDASAKPLNCNGFGGELGEADGEGDGEGDDMMSVGFSAGDGMGDGALCASAIETVATHPETRNASAATAMDCFN